MKTNDWILYCQHFEHILLTNSITDDDPKKHLFLAMMGGATFKLLANLIAPKSPGEVEYAEIHKDHYKPKGKPIKIVEQLYFYKQDKLTTCRESVAEHLAELQRLATTCKFGAFLNKALCNQFVCELSNPAM